MEGCLTFKDHDLELDLGLGHTAYRCASLIDLYLHAKFHWNQIFLWTYVRMYLRMDAHLRHFMSSTQKSQP